MTVAVVVIAALAVAAILLALRNGGLRDERAKAESRAGQLEQQLQSLSREFGEYKGRVRRQVADLYADIETLEKDLADCADPGDHRRRLERLLSKAETANRGARP